MTRKFVKLNITSITRQSQSSLLSLHWSMGVCEKEANDLSMAKLNNNDTLCTVYLSSCNDLSDFFTMRVGINFQFKCHISASILAHSMLTQA